MEKIIRIQAKCDRFEIDEQVEEKKSVQRLKQIRATFIHGKLAGRKRSKKYVGSDKLQVNTSVVNPSMF